MPATSAPDLASEVQDGILKYLWRQWAAIGATVTGQGQANAIIDPEVLILTSLWMLDFEQRLADVIVSWVQINSSLVSIQRLTNLRGEFPMIVRDRLSSLAAVGVEEAKDVRWQSLHQPKSPDLGARSNKVRAVVVGSPSWPTLLLQLRRGFGVGAKADVLAFLLGTSGRQGDWSSVAMIAAETRYTPAAVRRVADDLAAARFIQMPSTPDRHRGVQRLYSADLNSWSQLLRISASHIGWGYWRERFLFIIDVLTWIKSLSGRDVSPYARDVEARELITRHSSALLRDRVLDPLEFSAAELDVAYLENSTRQLLSWIGNVG